MDSLQEILFTLRQNKLRTGLTAFGVFWGILMLILLLGAGRGMENGFKTAFGVELTDMITISSQVTSIAYQGFPIGRRIDITQDDLVAIDEQVPAAHLMSGDNRLRLYGGAGVEITYQEKFGSFDIQGIVENYFNVRNNFSVKYGRNFNQLDQLESRKVIIIGRKVAERFFPTPIDALTKEIQINGISFKVVGVIDRDSNRDLMLERIFMPNSTLVKAFGGGRRMSVLFIRPEKGGDAIALEKQLREVLFKRHNIAPDDKKGIRFDNKARSAEKFNQMFTGLNLFIWIVGIGTLLAGIVGVSNIMVVTVNERTREIGIRKALGARPSSIVSQLLLESVLVTCVAGYLGLVLGVFLLEAVSSTLQKLKIDLPFFKQPEIDLSLAISALVVLIIAGVIAGLVPAVRAAKISPVEAMRAD